MHSKRIDGRADLSERLDQTLALVTGNLAALSIVAYLVRASLAIALYYLFGRTEYTDDIQFHLQLASDPFYYFHCRHADWSQQPPLLGAVETTLLPFVRTLGPFFGARLAYAAWDIAGSVILIRALGRHGWDTSLIRLMLLFGPLNIYASVVSAQDETITYCFACVCAALVLQGRETAAFVFACLAVVAAKILFLPVALGLALALALAPSKQSRSRLIHLATGAAILVGAYSWAALCAYPASKFVLAATHTINIWQVLADYLERDWRAIFRISIVCLGVVGAMQLAAAAMRRQATHGGRPRPTVPDPILAMLLVLLSFLGFFYHVVPEYFLVLLPFLVIDLKRCQVPGIALVTLVTILLAVPLLPDVLRYFVRFDLGPHWIGTVHKAAGALVSAICLLASCCLIGLHFHRRPITRFLQLVP